MGVEFVYPWALAALPVSLLIVWALYRRANGRPVFGRGAASPRKRLTARTLRGRVALAMRVAGVVLACLALAAPSLLIGSPQSATWVLLDASDSTRSARGTMDSAVRAALSDPPRDLSAGVIAFGEKAMVEAPISREGAAFSGVRTDIGAADSDLGAALTLAGALLPSDTAGRVVVVSDGRVADVSSEAALLAARGVAVDVLKLGGEAAPDAQVTQVSIPSTAYQGQKLTVTVRVDSNVDTTGTLVLYQNRAVAGTRDVTLRKGRNTFVFTDTATASGVVTYEAQLAAAGDENAANNRRGAYTAVSGAPNVLLVEGADGEGRELSKLLAAAGFRVERALPAGVPDTAEAMRQFDAILLANVDADDLSAGQIAALDGAVRTLGRGLCVFGGDRSYALGNYRGSELEKLLPVTIDVKNKLRMPSLALMLVLDKSGSMTSGQFGTTRLELSKEAAMRAAEVLTANDQVGVIAFDDAAKWVVPLQKAEDVPAIQSLIGSIRPGGGTAFFGALYETYNALHAADAKIKHVIFLTDGEPGDGGYEEIVTRMAAEGITFSTVAVGSGANAGLLRSLAVRGEGRAYTAGEFDNIPKIFAKETFLVSGSYVQNRVFTPVVTESGALTDFAGFPTLSGYLAATEKELATVSLVSDTDEPILAWWQTGAGRVLAFTSDTNGAWSRDFLAWEDATRFFSGLVTHVLPGGGGEGEMTAARAGDTLRVTYQAPDGADVTGLTTRVSALLPDGSRAEAELSETAPGVYAGELPAAQVGAYALTVTQTDAGGDTARALEGGAVVSYADEYDLTATADTGALERLAERTGGRVLTDAAELLSGRGGRTVERRSMTAALLWTLLAVFMADVALRRLPWEATAVRAIAGARARRAAKFSAAKPAVSGAGAGGSSANVNGGAGGSSASMNGGANGSSASANAGAGGSSASANSKPTPPTRARDRHTREAEQSGATADALLRSLGDRKKL